MCDGCPHAKNSICTKYGERLKLIDVVEDETIFERVEDCKQ